MRYFIKLAYRGTNYHGWQIQPNAISVQETIEKCLSIKLRQPIKAVGSGRTDTGVHATQMFIHFDFEEELKEDFIPLMNRFLPKDIVFYQLFKMVDTAHTRFDATSRTYHYDITTIKSPFHIDTLTYTHLNLDFDLMNQAAKILLEHTDFTSFARLHADAKTNICDVRLAKWVRLAENQWRFVIQADRFLRNMVRSVVGTLFLVGTHKISLTDFKAIIDAKDRSRAGASAPATGLFLVEITYPKNLFL